MQVDVLSEMQKYSNYTDSRVIAVRLAQFNCDMNGFRAALSLALSDAEYTEQLSHKRSMHQSLQRSHRVSSTACTDLRAVVTATANFS